LKAGKSSFFPLSNLDSAALLKDIGPMQKISRKKGSSMSGEVGHVSHAHGGK